MCKKRPFSRILQTLLLVALGFVVAFTTPCWGQTYGTTGNQGTLYQQKNRHKTNRKAQKNRFENKSAGEQTSYGHRRGQLER